MFINADELFDFENYFFGLHFKVFVILSPESPMANSLKYFR